MKTQVVEMTRTSVGLELISKWRPHRNWPEINNIESVNNHKKLARRSENIQAEMFLQNQGDNGVRLGRMRTQRCNGWREIRWIWVVADHQEFKVSCLCQVHQTGSAQRDPDLRNGKGSSLETFTEMNGKHLNRLHSYNHAQQKVRLFWFHLLKNCEKKKLKK